MFAGLPLALFGSSVFLTMQALSLCCEPNGWLVKGAEMLHRLVSDARHLYSGQGAVPLRKGPACVLSLQDPFPAPIFPRTGLPQRTSQGTAVSAAQRLGLDKEEIQPLSKIVYSTYKPAGCFGAFILCVKCGSTAWCGAAAASVCEGMAPALGSPQCKVPEPLLF